MGCGEGYGSRGLINRGASSVEGIDISQEMINLAKEKEKEKIVVWPEVALTYFLRPDMLINNDKSIFLYCKITYI